MEDERKRNEVKTLLDAIKSSEVWEARISLVNQLEDLRNSDASNLVLIIECLPDSICLGISHCTLNRKILSVASKCLEINTSTCLSHFLILGTKASMWCRKHLQVTLVSDEQTLEEEHFITLLQLLLDSLRFSSATIVALTRPPYIEEKTRMLMVENFILEQLNLTRTSISEIKKFQHVSSELVKAVQVILDAAVKLCRSYFESINLDASEVTVEATKSFEDDIPMDFPSHVANVTAFTIENLHELGILAAAGGGSLVTVLNVSWKGVVSLLQLGKKVLAGKSLRHAAEAWFSSHKGELTLPEAKRTFLPIKFYLINAVRISSDHPHEAMNGSGDITKCVLLISYFGVLFAKEVEMRAASEALADLLEPTSFLLLYAILSSTDISSESKSQILDCLFTDQNDFSSLFPEKNGSIMHQPSFDGSLAADHDDLPRAGTLALGRVMLLLNLLKSSASFKEEVTSMISKKLGYLLNLLVTEDVYPFILVSHIPVLYVYGSNKGIAWKPMLHFLLHSLKIFMIAASSSSMVSKEVEDFLHQNLFHPHCLCLEIVVELWCFFMRHAEPEVSNQVFDHWISLLQVLGSSEAALDPLSPLRRLARSLCSVLTHAAQPTIDHVYSSIFDDGKSSVSSTIRIAVLTEGFPLNSLSGNLKSLSAQSILGNFQRFTADYGKCLDHGSSATLSSTLLALSCAIRSSHRPGAADPVLDPSPLSAQAPLAAFMADLCHMEITEREEDPTSAAAWGLSHMLLRERHWAFLHLSLAGFGYFAARTSCTQLWRFVPHDAALSYDTDTGNEPSEERFMAQLKAFLEREATPVDQLDDLRKEAALLRTMAEVNEKRSERKRKRRISEEISSGISMLQRGLELLKRGLSRDDGVGFKEHLSGQLSSLQGLILGLSASPINWGGSDAPPTVDSKILLLAACVNDLLPVCFSP
ncbi:unnamed protein product [Spirodela intermedia]|uniref:Uncharacterized protein n=1 Tax=Spirodela intermedia TaxID=51605 RepID=A0A7I8IXN0_SPIIN|nr:unnamed protein product [Spirodela intermedia]CAA6662559.1 unnamed protein product [Spirodela intermedia]